MKGKPKKSPREKDLTSRYFSGNLDEDRVEQGERFGDRSRHFQQRKTEKTAILRAAEETVGGDIDALPVGDVIRVYSLFCEVESAGRIWFCVVRRTLTKVAAGFIVVGDQVRFRDGGTIDEQGRPEAVIEAQPIVANADQMLIVAALAEPWPKWGLIDRMLVAARAGGLFPIVCMNKADLIETKGGKKELTTALAAMDHYRSIGITTLQTSVPAGLGLEKLKELLANKTTVLSGHSGVGKSSLIRAVQPSLDLRVAAISNYTGKGRHTTTTAHRFALDGGGYVIDTPGVKLFGLWNVTRENLPEFFPDIEAGTAPQWRQESYQRILESLPA